MMTNVIFRISVLKHTQERCLTTTVFIFLDLVVTTAGYRVLSQEDVDRRWISVRYQLRIHFFHTCFVSIFYNLRCSTNATSCVVLNSPDLDILAWIRAIGITSDKRAWISTQQTWLESSNSNLAIIYTALKRPIFVFLLFFSTSSSPENEFISSSIK